MVSDTTQDNGTELLNKLLEDELNGVYNLNSPVTVVEPPKTQTLKRSDSFIMAGEEPTTTTISQITDGTSYSTIVNGPLITSTGHPHITFNGRDLSEPQTATLSKKQLRKHNHEVDASSLLNAPLILYLV